MTYAIRGLIFLGALALIIMIERLAFGITQPVAKVMHWLFVLLLAFELQMLINDLLVYCGADYVTAYALRYDNNRDKEIPILYRLLIVYPVFAAGFDYCVWYFAHHWVAGAVFRGPGP